MGWCGGPDTCGLQHDSDGGRHRVPLGIKPLTVGMHSADLIREPNNEYDTNAIAVHIEGNMTGYLSRDQAERYAPRWT